MASSRWSRRNILKAFGITVGGTFFPFSLWGKNETGEHLILPDNPLHRPLAKPVTAITLGAGARGNVYGDYAVEYPDQLDIVGVAEPIAIRNERYAKKHAIPDANRFQTWEDVFKKPKFADAVIISTPDQLHYGPCMAALKMGYNVLLEKPISPSEKECRDILELTKKTGKVVAVCHVLRYAPYFIKLRELMQSGAIGEIISLQHMEPIEHTHMAHSYVRGNWHNSAATTPILLAKSCHDLDIIKWMLGKESQSIQAFGDLKWFRKENAPAGSTARCTDGCAVESTCPYSALKIYYRKRQRTYVFDLPEDKDKQGDAILDFLKTTDYGRCVYRMDNDQCDHYTTNILFKGNITASFNMEAFTPWGGRRTRVMGSMGFIEGDMSKFTIYDFRTDQSKTYESKVLDVANYKNEGHGGGDWRLVADWIQAVAQQNPNLLTSTIDASIESHIMCFMAEESRANKKVMDIRM
ncbi:MAG: Gfo/Idh/MocA family oxidoreductase [Chitinophagaceae bacterium]|nr:MAG: Gfo/Idh/MocA family oxidoreductase [Chitinophagaceae bacterium]